MACLLPKDISVNEQRKLCLQGAHFGEDTDRKRCLGTPVGICPLPLFLTICPWGTEQDLLSCLPTVSPTRRLHVVAKLD